MSEIEKKVKVVVTGDTKGLKTAQKKTNSIFSSISKGAIAAGVSFAAIGAGVLKSINAFSEADKVQRKLEATLKATSSQAGVTANDINKLSVELQKSTTYGDEALTTLQTSLLKFSNIKKDVFEPTTRAAVDMAAALNIDLTAAAQMVGRALQDPIQGLMMLRRSGILFNEEQKAQIETLIRNNDLLGAQTIVLDQLNKKFAGTAQAVAGGTGVFKQISEDIGDLFEILGERTFKLVEPALKIIRDEIRKLKTDLTESTGIVKILSDYLQVLKGVLVSIGGYLAGAFIGVLFTLVRTTTAATLAVNLWAARLLITIGVVKALRLAQLGLNTVMKLSPFGLLIAGIAGVIQWAGGLEKTWLSLKSTFLGFNQIFSQSALGRYFLGKEGQKVSAEDFEKEMQAIAERSAQIDRERAAAENPQIPQDNGDKLYGLETERTIYTRPTNKSDKEGQGKSGKSGSGGEQATNDPYGLGYEIPAGATDEDQVALLAQAFPDKLMTAEQREVYLEGLEAQKQEELSVTEKYQKRILQSERDFRQEMQSTIGGSLVMLLNSEKMNNEQRKRAAEQFNSDLLTLANHFGKKNKNISKAFNIGQATMNTYVAFTRTLAQFPYPINIPLAGLVLGAGMAKVADIAGAAKGTIVDGTDTGVDNRLMRVRSGEAIIPPQYVSGVMPALADMIRQEDRTGKIENAPSQNMKIAIELRGDAGQFINATLIRDRQAGLI